jgi:precorrin-8X/cobalt-precorrin-8 methylmutase
MEIVKPMDIENKSFEIIKSEIDKNKFSKIPENMINIVVRVIHATADFDFLDILKYSDDFYNKATDAIKNGCSIVADIKMVKYGISQNMCKEFGVTVESFIDHPDVVNIAKKENITRSIAAMRLFAKNADDGIIVIGNAPTALFEIIELHKEGFINPAVVVGVPVGFVGADRSKELLADYNKIPYITSLGRKGGTPVAVAIINALLKNIKNF